MSDYLYCSLDSAGILKFYKAITKPLDLCMRQNRKTNLSIRLTDDCKNNLRRKRSTLLLLTWMPSFLMVPNRLNSSSNCCGVAFKGRFRTYMACASTLKMIRKNVRCSQLKSISSLATSLGFDDTFWILKAATLSVRTESWRISNHSGCRRGLFLWFWGCRPGGNCRSWWWIFFHDFYLEHNNKIP